MSVLPDSGGSDVCLRMLWLRRWESEICLEGRYLEIEVTRLKSFLSDLLYFYIIFYKQNLSLRRRKKKKY